MQTKAIIMDTEPPKHVVYSCKYPSCTNVAYRRCKNEKRFFKFPTDLKVRKSWKEVCHIPADFTGCNNYRICEDHFDDEDFVGIRKIANYAIPCDRTATHLSHEADHDYCHFIRNKHQEDNDVPEDHSAPAPAPSNGIQCNIPSLETYDGHSSTVSTTSVGIQCNLVFQVKTEPLIEGNQLPPATNGDEYDRIAKIWATELRKMKSDQQLFAKKAINEVLFEGQLETLHRHSIAINKSNSTPSKQTKATRYYIIPGPMASLMPT